MTRRRAVCTTWATVEVSWSWEGARCWPTVYQFCEPCADVFCAWLERGMDADCAVPDNLVVDEFCEPGYIECRTVQESAA